MTSRPHTTTSPAAALSRSNRVAEPNALFWVLKIVTTGMGETISDFLVKTFAPTVVVPVATLLLAVALLLQLRAGRYRPARYWTTALMVSVVGTMVADVLHVALGVPYAVSASAFALLLAAVFLRWWRVERTLSVHEITTPRRERFYWTVVIVTFALGTALGDLTATGLRLGYLASGVGFAVLFLLPALFHAALHRGAVATFWSAYVLTRPLGASFADWFASPVAHRGLGAGTGPVSLVLLVVFVLLVLVAELVRPRRPASLRGPTDQGTVEDIAAGRS